MLASAYLEPDAPVNNTSKRKLEDNQIAKMEWEIQFLQTKAMT